MVAVSLTFVGDLRADAIDDYNVSLKFYKDQRWEQAEEAFDRFLTTYPDHERAPAARLYLAQSRVHQDEYSAARDAFRTFLDSHSEHPDVYLAMYRAGECSYFLGDYEAAKSELDRFVSAYPKHELGEYALHYLGDTQLRLQDPQAAYASLQLQIDRFPDGRLADDARFLQGRAALTAENTERARELFTVLAAKPESPRGADAQLELAMLLYQAKQYPEAQVAFDKVRTNFPQSKLIPAADINAGYACYHQGDFDAAIVRFDRAATAPAQLEDALFWKGMSLKSKQDYSAATAEFRKLAETTQDRAVALRALFHGADSQLRAGEQTQALTMFLKVVETDPSGPLAPDALHLATEAALLQGSLDEARKLHGQFERDYRSHGLWLLQKLLLGRIELAQGDRAAEANDANAARQSFEQAASVFAEVVAESQVRRTSLLGRLLLGRAQDRLESYEAVVAALAPTAELLKETGSDGEFAESLVLLSRALLKLDRNAEASDAAQLMVDRFSTHPQIPEGLANLALANARLDRATELQAVVDRLWADTANRATAERTTYEIADQAYSAMKWATAAQLFERLATDGSDEYRAAAQSGLGYARYQEGSFTAAADAFGKLLQAGTAERVLASDAAHMRALALRKDNQMEPAAEAYLAAIRQFALPPGTANLSPQDLQVTFNVYQSAKGLARLRRDQMQLDPADQAYQSAFDQLRLLPDDRQAELDQLLQEWAVLHYEAMKYDRSDALFQQLIALRPASPFADDAKLYLGESHFFSGRLPEARAAFEALEKDSAADEFVLQRTLVLLIDMAAERKDWPEQTRLAKELQSRFPQGKDIPYARYRLGEALLQAGDAAGAAAELTALHDSGDATIKSTAWFPSVRVLLAEATLQQPDYPAVERVVAAFHEQDPESPLLYQADEILGRRFKNEARWDEARQAFLAVVESKSGALTETAAKAQLQIAETYLLQENYGEAVIEYYKVHLKYAFPDYQAPALFQAARCDELRGRWADAVKTYETLLAEFPGHEYAVKAAPLLEEAKKRVPVETPAN
jgi:TolA-binding protein